MRVRALILVGCLLWASSALADPNADFEKARIAYVKKDYVEANARFEAMLDPKTGTLKTPELIRQAEFGWGAVKLALGDKTGAHTLWEKVIRDTQGNYQPDPLTYPTDVINDFIQEKSDLAETIRQQIERAAAEAAAQRKRDAEERARLQARVKELEKLTAEETVVVENSRLLALLPFGIGQFANHDKALGWFFLFTEGAAVLTTVVLFFPYRYNVDQANAVFSDGSLPPQYRIQLADQYAAVAQNVRTADFITLGALGALVVSGIVEAQIAYKPSFSYTRKRKAASLWPSLSPLPGAGAFVGVGGRF